VHCLSHSCHLCLQAEQGALFKEGMQTVLT
jgi:hypothetical protein